MNNKTEHLHRHDALTGDDHLFTEDDATS